VLIRRAVPACGHTNQSTSYRALECLFWQPKAWCSPYVLQSKWGVDSALAFAFEHGLLHSMYSVAIFPDDLSWKHNRMSNARCDRHMMICTP